MNSNPRYRGLQPNPEKLGVTLLEEGEASRPVRVRARVEVFDWLGTLGAAGLGRLLTAAYEEAQRAAAPEVAPVPTVRLVPSLLEPTKAQHREIIEQLHDGGTLTQQGDVFTLRTAGGVEQIVHPKTGRFLVKSGALVALPADQARASASQSPDSTPDRKREASKAPGRRKA